MKKKVRFAPEPEEPSFSKEGYERMIKQLEERVFDLELENSKLKRQLKK